MSCVGRLSSEKISIQKDLWLSGYAGYKLNNSISNDGVRFVSDLINAYCREWRAHLIYSTFLEHVVNKIMHIPLARETHEDMQV